MRKNPKRKPKDEKSVRIVNANPAGFLKKLAEARKDDPSGALAMKLIDARRGVVVSVPGLKLENGDSLNPPVFRLRIKGTGTMITAEDNLIVARMKKAGFHADDIQAFIGEQAARRRAKQKPAHDPAEAQRPKRGRRNMRDELARLFVRYTSGECIDSLARVRGCAPDSLRREFSRLKANLKKTD